MSDPDVYRSSFVLFQVKRFIRRRAVASRLAETATEKNPSTVATFRYMDSLVELDDTKDSLERIRRRLVVVTCNYDPPTVTYTSFWTNHL